MGGKFQTTSPLKAQNRFTPKKFMHTSREGLYQSCINIGEISNFGFLQNVFSFLLTWDHMGEKPSCEILLDSTQEEGSLPKLYK